MGRRAAATAARSEIAPESHVAVDEESLRPLTGAVDEEPPPPGGAPPSLPAPVKVMLGGRLVEVAPDVAEAIAEEQRAMEARSRVAPPAPEREPASRTTGPSRPAASLAISDYAEYDRQMQAYEAHRDLQLEQRIESKYSSAREQERAQESLRRETDAFLARVRTAEPLLDGEDDLVFGAMRKVMARHPGVNLDMRDPRTQELVVAESVGDLVRIGEKSKGATPRPPRLEGQTARSTVVPPAPDTKKKKPVSIADLQRSRNAARRGRKE